MCWRTVRCGRDDGRGQVEGGHGRVNVPGALFRTAAWTPVRPGAARSGPCLGLRVAVDVTPLLGARTGVARTVEGLLARCPRPRPTSTVVPVRAERPGPAGSPAAPASCPCRRRWRCGRGAGSTCRGPTAGSATPTSCTAPTSSCRPTRRRPATVTVHDCWCARHPDLCRPDVGGRCRPPCSGRSTAAPGSTSAPSGSPPRCGSVYGAERVAVVPFGAPPVGAPAAGRRRRGRSCSPSARSTAARATTTSCGPSAPSPPSDPTCSWSSPAPGATPRPASPRPSRRLGPLGCRVHLVGAVDDATRWRPAPRGARCSPTRRPTRASASRCSRRWRSACRSWPPPSAACPRWPATPPCSCPWATRTPSPPASRRVRRRRGPAGPPRRRRPRPGRAVHLGPHTPPAWPTCGGDALSGVTAASRVHAGQLLQPVPGGHRPLRAATCVDALPGGRGRGRCRSPPGRPPDGIDGGVHRPRLAPRARLRYELWHRLRRPAVRVAGRRRARHEPGRAARRARGRSS